MKRNIPGIFFLLFTLLILGCGKENSEESSKTKKENPIIPVTVISAQLSDFYEYGEYYGRVQGINRAPVICSMGGTVESVRGVEGMKVRIGESLGSISAEKARIALDSATLNERISRENYTLQKKFLLTGNSSQRDVDNAHLRWLNSKTQLIDAQKDFVGALCIAPINGVIVSRNIETDEVILPGFESLVIEDLSKMEVKIGIPEADMKGVKEGSTAEITLDLYPGRVWKGVLTRYARKSSESNLTFDATLIMDNKDGDVFSGTTAKVKLLRNSYLQKIVIPTDTIINENNKNFVMLLNNNKAEKRLIEILASNEDQSVVLSGIEAGDVIIQEGNHLLVDSQEVMVINNGVPK